MTGVLVTAPGMAVALAMGTSAYAQDKVEKGTKLYTEQKCNLCHSIAGKGSAKGSLDGVGSKLKEAEIREWSTDPKDMTAKTKAECKPAYAVLT